jgi:polygalacturonase
MFISPINCTKVYIEGISLEKTIFWNIVPIYCNNVIIRGVTVNSVGIPRGDGMDIESSKNVLIEYCNLSCGDDCFTLKAGRGADGIRVNKPTENVIVRFCLAEKGHGGITCGSETAGIIRNLFVHDCVFANTGVGIRFKTRRPRGGGGENLFYERIRINIQGDALKWDMLGSHKWVGELANRLPAREINRLTPRYKNIHIKDIVVENASHFAKIRGIPESPLDNLTIENAKVNCKKFIFAHDFCNSHFRNIDINTEDSLLTFIDSKNIHLSNLNFNKSASLDITGELSDSIVVKTSQNIKDAIYVVSNK